MKNMSENGIKCGFLSLEMLKEQVYVKMISAEVGVSYSDVVKGNFDDDMKYKLLLEGEKFDLNENLIIQEASVESLNSLRTRMRRMKEVHGVQVLFIDYITLIQNIQKGKNSVESLVAISSLIRIMLNELRITGLVISQLNRTHADKSGPPEMNHLYGSGQLEKDAHAIFMLHKEELVFSPTVKTTQGFDNNIAQLWIRKNRFGPNDVKMDFSFENGVFEELT
jgi:replicative DNA helicase